MPRKPRSKNGVSGDPAADPFGERTRLLPARHHHVLGTTVRFSSNSAALLKLADAAFARLPRQFLGARLPILRVHLRLDPSRTLGDCAAPPTLAFHGAGDSICATCDRANYAVVTPRLNSALVVVSRDMLRFPYHVRYELIEFAVYTLATRSLGLVPLHAACLAQNGQALLLLGNSGAGKSTLALHGILAGMELLSEDAVFIDGQRLLVAGVPNFLHLRPDALRFLSAPVRRTLRGSPTIVRRSGVRKLELDARKLQGRWPSRRFRVNGVILLGSGPAGTGPLLSRISRPRLLNALRRTQRYGSNQQGWQTFMRRVSRISAHTLRRGSQPDQATALLAALLRKNL